MKKSLINQRFGNVCIIIWICYRNFMHANSHITCRVNLVTFFLLFHILKWKFQLHLNPYYDFQKLYLIFQIIFRTTLREDDDFLPWLINYCKSSISLTSIYASALFVITIFSCDLQIKHNGTFRQKHLVHPSHFISLFQQTKQKHFSSLTCHLGLTGDPVLAIEIQKVAVQKSNIKNTTLQHLLLCPPHLEFTSCPDRCNEKDAVATMWAWIWKSCARKNRIGSWDSRLWKYPWPGAIALSFQTTHFLKQEKVKLIHVRQYFLLLIT